MRTSFPTTLASCILMVMTSCFSVSAAHGAYRAKAEGKKLIYSHRGETIVIEAWGRDGLRVRVTPAGGKQTSDWALDIPSAKAGKIEIAAREATIRNGKVSARIHDIYTQRGRLQFFKHVGEKKTVMLSEHDYVVGAHNPGTRIFKPAGDGLFHSEVHFASRNGERFYGMGLNSTGRVNLKGCVIDLYQRHVKHVVPFVVSSEGYGFLWNNPSLGRVELGNNMTRWVSYGCRQLDYYITAGDSYADIMSNYADVTGHAPRFPYWASGFWQCKLRYKTQKEFLGVAREFKKRGLPLSVHVIDFLHWKQLGDWKLDPKFWPDPKAMVKELNDMGVRIMISPWILVSEKSENFKYMKEHGLFTGSIGGKNDTVRFSGRAYQYDPTNPAAAKYLWSKWKKNYVDIGISTFWLDPSDEFHDIKDYDQVLFHIGPAKEAHGYFPVAHQKNIYNGLIAAGEKEVVTICRSSWAGSQRWGAAPAHHDIMSSFEHLEEYMKAGLNLAMSGIPWGASGIGGFVTRDRTSPRFHELMVRWYQYGVFCPIFRTHGCRPNNEAWTIGGIAYPHVRAAMLLRENLRPYIMKQMHLASKKGLPPMRPVFFDFEADPKTAIIEDQYLFGGDLLVAPITKYEARSREVYLPAGVEWTDAWTGRKFKGGQVIKADAPIKHIPVYVRGDKPELLKCFKNLYEDTGVIEAENLTVLSKSSSRVEPQRMDGFGSYWSAGSQMVWWGKLSKGDTMVLEVPVEKTAEYEVQLYLSKAHDYGIFTFQLDGGTVSKAIDIYDPKLQAPTVFKLEPMKLAIGKHKLKIQCQGKNPKSANTLIGIDYIALKKKGK